MKVMSMVKMLACAFACVLLLASCGVTVTPNDGGGVNITPGNGTTQNPGTSNPHVHAFVKDDLGNDFDCTVGATVVSRCACGETKTETIKPTGHQLSHHEGKAPTCLSGGYENYEECAVCSYTTFKNIPAPGHQYTDYAAKAPTCTEPGWTAYKACSACDSTTRVDLPKTDHTYVNGFCACGAKDPDLHEHRWDNGVTVAATCMKNGSITYTCLDATCGATKQEEILAKGHTYKNVDAKAPTCTEDGYFSYVTCTNENCDGVGISTPVVDPALDHDDVHYEAKAATCTEFGWNAYSVCQRCDRSTYVEISALGHSDQNGYCGVCGQKIGDHVCVWDSGYESTAPTCTATGVKTFTCTDENCGDTKTESIPALGHDNVHYDKKNATCEEDGWRAYDVCNRCGYSTFISIPAKGHSYNSSSITTQPTCTTGGVRTYKCVCGASYDVDIEKLGHDWGNWYVTKDATCTASGQEQRTCLNDSKHVETRGVSPIGHIWGEWHVSKAATCEKPGEEISHCLNDSSHEKKQTIPMADHTLNADGFCTECKNQIKPPLATPSITTNGFGVFWNAVSGATEYELILQYNGKRENLMLTATSCDLTEYFLECTSITVQIRAIAELNGNYSNSSYCVFEFVIPNGTIVNHAGLGQSVNLLTGAYTDYKNGSTNSIFNENVLNRVDVDDYSDQEVQHYSDATYSESLESYIESLNKSISDKMSVNASVSYPGVAKVTTDYSFEVDSRYEKKSYSETQAIFYDIYYQYTRYQTGIKTYLAKIMAMDDEEREAAMTALTSVMFRNDAMKLQNGEMTPEAFIERYGTHIITEAIYGAEFNAHYERLSTKDDASATFGKDIQASITASIVASMYGIKFDLDTEASTTVSSSTFVSSTTSDVHSKFTFDAIGGTTPVNMTAMSFAEFSAVCEAWANSLENASNYPVIDVPNGSLWFVWDFLGDEYAEAKAILNGYFYMTCDEQSDALNAKINGMYQDFFTFDKDTGVLTIDFSARQEPNGKDVDLAGVNYTDGVFTIFNGREITICPKFNGQEITKVVFKGGYMTEYEPTGTLITSTFINLNIKFHETWSEEIVVEFQNFGYIAPRGCSGLDFSETKSEKITIIVTGAAYIKGGLGLNSVGLPGIQAADKNLQIQGTENMEVVDGDGINAPCVNYNGHSYYLVAEPMRWDEAKVYAEEMGGYLIVITSKAENNVVKQLQDASGIIVCWLGAEKTSGQWRWVTGEAFVYQCWYPGEPNNAEGIEFYLGRSLGDIDNVKWNDFPIDDSTIQGFIIEIDSN